jgi:hypothetical protein
MTTAPPLSDDDFSHQVQRAVRALPDAPEALQRAAIALWQQAAPAPSLAAQAQAVWNRLTAVLRFDSWTAPALAAGMRSLRSPIRHLLFAAQGRDIDLRIAPAADRFCLAGQILGPDETGLVLLAGPDGALEAPREVALDALGEFRIDGVPRGSYRLTLRLGADQIELPPVEVGEPPLDLGR